MSHRYTREEKRKWVAAPTQTNRKPPVQIPASDTTALIEENKFTLIGRVTNPAHQNTKALVEFFLQHWNVTGRFTGRDLGPLLFQFRFENEKDMLTILNKGPFHFKRWMILLQRWKPVVSEKFPAHLSFWIQIHGLPLHYWYDEAVRAIGKELGSVEDCISTQAKVRVLINGLQPLEMVRDISLPSGEITQVEFDYDKLEKHCFNCKSLTHEKDDCPLLEKSRDRAKSPRRVDISQSNTLARLDERRKKYEERKKEREAYAQNHRAASHDFSRRNDYEVYRRDPRDNTHRQHSYGPVTSEYRRGRETSNQERNSSHGPAARTGSRNNLKISNSAYNEDDTRTRPQDSGSKTIQSPVLPPVVTHSWDLRRGLPHREEGDDSPVNVSSDRRPAKERILPALTPHSTDLRRALTLRDEGQGSGSHQSADRPSAKERLSLPSNGKPRLVTQGNSTGSIRLQDIEIQYLEEIMETPRPDNTRASGSKPFGTTRNSPLDEASPIRSLSEDRRHVSTRLGPLPTSSPLDRPPQSRLTDKPVIVTRSVAKRKAGNPQIQKRYSSSPLQGISLKKRREDHPRRTIDNHKPP
ncbi:hypothetical protein Bca101_067698 [Brassica carinata]